MKAGGASELERGRIPVRRQFDRITFADYFGRQIYRQGRTAAGAFVRSMIDGAIEHLAQRPAMTQTDRKPL